MGERVDTQTQLNFLHAFNLSRIFTCAGGFFNKRNQASLFQCNLHNCG